MRSTTRGALVVLGAALIAIAGARPYASSWNDGSRLASVEALVDRGTWVIDDSIFVRPRPRDASNPYSLTISSSPVETGTLDKLFIHGHFYSDKPPVSTLYLAAVYWIVQKFTGLTAQESPHLFVELLTLASSGVAFVIGVFCIWLIALRLGLSERRSLFVTLSFAIATFAPVYARQVNNHILQLAVFALIFLLTTEKEGSPWLRAGAIGCLAGLGYTLDLGIGPVLIISTLAYTALKRRNNSALTITLWTAMCMLPFLALHHWLNFKIGGTFGPMNANPAYFEYPGSPFAGGHISGRWLHHSIFDFLLYMPLMMVGTHGFLLHNLPTLAILRKTPGLSIGSAQRRPELAYAVALILGSWTVYAIGSTNYGGLCCSVRWFVPLLIPVYLILIQELANRPKLWGEFRVLTGFGVVLAAMMFWIGPFGEPSPRIYWPIVGASVLALYKMRFHARAALNTSASL